jgi:hypothetical protein
MGKEWARDHSDELAKEFFEHNYEEAVNQFTSERLQSYYLEQSELAGPALNALQYAQSLMPLFHQGALIFAVTATELKVKNVLLKPIISGLVHSEDLASFIADLTTKHSGMDRFQNLLTEILSQFGGFELKTFKRADSAKTLWNEMDEIQKVRNAVIHKGETVGTNIASLSISAAEVLLHEIFPEILRKLGLHLHKPITICALTHPGPIGSHVGRISLMAVRLEARMDDSGREYLYGEGFASSDIMAGLISDVLRRNGLHYEEPFVCFAIYGDDEDPHNERQPAFQAFGPPVILKPELLGKITITCATDFQNAISRNQRNPGQIKKLFREANIDCRE